MSEIDWLEGFPGSVTVCDKEGTIIAMNRAAGEAFAASGGKALIGSSVLACHPEPARAKLAQIMASGERNVYTVERNGAKKLIYQVPWSRDGEYAGFVELMLPLPAEIPNHIRG